VRIYTEAQAEFFRPVSERTVREVADLLREVLVAVAMPARSPWQRRFAAAARLVP